MSPMLTPDTSEAEDFSVPITPGTYPARIVKVEPGKSKAGNSKIDITVKITVDGKERTRHAHLVIEGAGSLGFDQCLRACNMKDLADAYRDPQVKPKPPFDTDSLIGCEPLVIIDENMYKDDAGNEKKGDQIKGWLRA